MRLNNGWVAGLVAMLVALGACKKSAETWQRLTGAETSSTANSAADDELGEKLAKYISCTNTATDAVNKGEESYFSWVDPAKGPDPAAPTIRGIHPIHMGECERLIPEGNQLQPTLPELQTLAEHYLVALRAVDALAKPARQYYVQQDYKDDQLKRGQDMHVPLVAAFKKFDAAAKAFSSQIATLNDQISEKRLAQLEKDPEHRLAFLVEKQMWEAKKLVNLAQVATLAELDLNPYQAQLDVVAKRLDELNTYVSAHQEEANQAHVPLFIVSSADFLKSSKDLARRKRDNKNFDADTLSDSNPERVDGHPANVLKGYNALVERSNLVRL